MRTKAQEHDHRTPYPEQLIQTPPPRIPIQSATFRVIATPGKVYGSRWWQERPVLHDVLLHVSTLFLPLGIAAEATPQGAYLLRQTEPIRQRRPSRLQPQYGCEEWKSLISESS